MTRLGSERPAAEAPALIKYGRGGRLIGCGQSSHQVRSVGLSVKYGQSGHQVVGPVIGCGQSAHRVRSMGAGPLAAAAGAPGVDPVGPPPRIRAGECDGAGAITRAAGLWPQATVDSSLIADHRGRGRDRVRAGTRPTSTATPRFHSDAALRKRYHACEAWHPFENSTSLAEQHPPRVRALPLKPRHRRQN